ncbi:FecR/PupR family sigma factor regulator [Pseudomonas putida]
MNPQPLPTDLIEAAAQWVVRQDAGQLTLIEQAELANWLAQDPRHAAALSFARQTWAALAL